MELNPWSLDPKGIYWHRSDGRRTQTLGIGEFILEFVDGPAVNKAMNIAFADDNNISLEDVRVETSRGVWLA